MTQRIRCFGCFAALTIGLTLIGACRGNSSTLSNADSATDSNPLPEDASGSEAPADSATAPPPLAEPPPPPSSAFIALLPPEQTAEIQALGVSLVVPTAIPAGFSVASVETNQQDGLPSYQILYRDGGDRCFVVEYTAAGVGNIPATEYRIPVHPPLFEEGEYGLNYGSYSDPSLRSQFPEPELVSDWLTQGDGVYRLAGAAYINDALAPNPPCQDITPEEAVTIVESLALITDEIIGDG